MRPASGPGEGVQGGHALVDEVVPVRVAGVVRGVWRRLGALQRPVLDVGDPAVHGRQRPRPLLSPTVGGVMDSTLKNDVAKNA